MKSQEASPGWTIAKLHDVADVIVSNVDKKTAPQELPIRLCNYMDVYANDKINGDLAFMRATATHAEIEKFRLKQGDVLITKDSETPTDIAVPALVAEQADDLLCGYHLAILRPTGGVDPAFFAFQLRHPETNRHFRLCANGSTRYGLTLDAIRSAPLHLAPIRQQRRIAEILDTLDEAILKTEQLIEKLKLLKQGLLHDLLTRGIDDNGELRDPERHPEQFVDSPLGPVPKMWNIALLGNVVAQAGGVLQTGPFGSQLHAHEYTRDGVPVIMPQDLADGRVRTQNIARIPERRAGQLARHRLVAGDIVFARRGDLDRCAAVATRETGWLCGTGCLLLRITSPKFDSTWISAMYRHDRVQRQVLGMAVGSTMANLNTQILANLTIAFPSPVEQAAVAERLVAFDARIDTERQQADKLKLLKLGLADDLLTGRVRVPVAEEVPA